MSLDLAEGGIWGRDQFKFKAAGVYSASGGEELNVMFIFGILQFVTTLQK